MIERILEAADQIIERIKAQKGLSDDELRQLIEKKRAEYGGLLTEAGAAYAVAKDLGVEVSLETYTPIAKLKEGQQNVNVKGRIEQYFGQREYVKGDKKGTMSSFILKDDSGSVRVVVWDRPFSASPGTEVRITGAYVRQYGDRIELNVGQYGDIAFVESAFTPLNALSDGQRVDVRAKVVRYFGKKEYEREGKKQVMATAIIADETASRRCVIWPPHSATPLAQGQTIIIKGALVRKGREELEVHVQSTSTMSVEPHLERCWIADVRDGQRTEVRGTLVELYKPVIIDVCQKCGAVVSGIMCQKCGSSETTKQLIVSGELDDGTGVLRVNFYRSNAQKILKFDARDLEKDERLFERRRAELLGDELVCSGRIKWVEKWQRFEMSVTSVSTARIDDEIKRLRGA